MGGLDIAVNNAGINKNNAAEDTPESEWDTTFAVNTRGVFMCCQVKGLSATATLQTLLSATALLPAVLMHGMFVHVMLLLCWFDLVLTVGMCLGVTYTQPLEGLAETV